MLISVTRYVNAKSVRHVYLTQNLSTCAFTFILTFVNPIPSLSHMAQSREMYKSQSTDGQTFPFAKAVLKGQTSGDLQKSAVFLRYPARICRFLRKSAVLCGLLHLQDVGFPREVWATPSAIFGKRIMQF